MYSNVTSMKSSAERMRKCAIRRKLASNDVHNTYMYMERHRRDMRRALQGLESEQKHLAIAQAHFQSSKLEYKNMKEAFLNRFKTIDSRELQATVCLEDMEDVKEPLKVKYANGESSCCENHICRLSVVTRPTCYIIKGRGHMKRISYVPLRSKLYEKEFIKFFQTLTRKKFVPQDVIKKFLEFLPCAYIEDLTLVRRRDAPNYQDKGWYICPLKIVFACQFPRDFKNTKLHIASEVEPHYRSISRSRQRNLVFHAGRMHDELEKYYSERNYYERKRSTCAAFYAGTGYNEDFPVTIPPDSKIRFFFCVNRSNFGFF